jgi:ATP-dependent Clp protease adaptor protein ClpS
VSRQRLGDGRGLGPEPDRGPVTGQRLPNGRASAAPVEVEPSIEEGTGLDELLDPDEPWLVIVWNDPINLMSFVTFVFQKLFGYSKEKATKLMLDVHHKGRAVVSSGTRERAELDVYRLHEYGLWATMEPSS